MDGSLGTVTSQLAALVATYGLPVLFVVFLVKGTLIGKLLSTAVFLPGYVIAAGGGSQIATMSVIVATVGYMLGQLFLYLGLRKHGLAFLDRLPRVSVDLESDRAQRVATWFDEYGGLAIFVTNFLPWLRGLLTIPAATSSYPVGRYTVYTGSSTLLYHTGYVLLALLGLSIVR